MRAYAFVADAHPGPETMKELGDEPWNGLHAGGGGCETQVWFRPKLCRRGHRSLCREYPVRSSPDQTL
eukprot:8241393-Alexandrium_andersonii.AAC.1